MVVRAPGRAGAGGMFGSGLFVINPPWVLPQTLEAVMPWLVQALAEDETAGFDVEHRIP